MLTTIYASEAMFPQSCALVRAHTGREMSALKKLGAHIIHFPLKQCFCTYFIHFIHVILSICMSAGKSLHTKHFVHTQNLKNSREH